MVADGTSTRAGGGDRDKEGHGGAQQHRNCYDDGRKRHGHSRKRLRICAGPRDFRYARDRKAVCDSRKLRAPGKRGSEGAGAQFIPEIRRWRAGGQCAHNGRGADRGDFDGPHVRVSGDGAPVLPARLGAGAAGRWGGQAGPVCCDAAGSREAREACAG